MNTTKSGFLIVSSREENVNVFKKVARESTDFRMRFASDINTVNEIIRTSTPDILFCDLQFQQNNGNPLIKTYVNGNPHENFLICIKATEKEKYAEASLLKEGADDFIITPTSKTLLFKKIQAL